MCLTVKRDRAALICAARLFEKNGEKLFAVGGFVRNRLMGLFAVDIDVCSSVPPERVIAICGGHMGARLVNRRLGTVELTLGGVTMEHTTFRRESYGRGRDPVSVELGVTMDEDAMRRDFAMNAVYEDPLSGELFDPTGKGLGDIAARRLSTTADDPDIIMRDDGLRLMRLCRFAGELGAKAELSLIESAKRNAPLIDDVSRERIWAELSRSLLSDMTYGMTEGYLESERLLILTGVLARILPGAGMFRADIESAPDIDVRLAALLFENGAEKTAEALSMLRAPSERIKNVRTMLLAHELLTGGAAVEQAAALTGKKLFKKLDLLESALCFAGEANRAYDTDSFAGRDGVPYTVRDLDISGDDIASLGASGRQIGDCLNKLLLETMVVPAENARKKLLYRAKVILGVDNSPQR